PHLEHVPRRRLHSRVRDPEVGRRPRPRQRLRPPRRLDGAPEGGPPRGALPQPAREGVVRCRDVPRADAPARGRVRVALRRGVRLPQAGMVKGEGRRAKGEWGWGLASLALLSLLGCEVGVAGGPSGALRVADLSCPPGQWPDDAGRCVTAEVAFTAPGGAAYG